MEISSSLSGIFSQVELGSKIASTCTSLRSDPAAVHSYLCPNTGEPCWPLALGCAANICCHVGSVKCISAGKKGTMLNSNLKECWYFILLLLPCQQFNRKRKERKSSISPFLVCQYGTVHPCLRMHKYIYMGWLLLSVGDLSCAHMHGWGWTQCWRSWTQSMWVVCGKLWVHGPAVWWPWGPRPHQHGCCVRRRFGLRAPSCWDVAPLSCCHPALRVLLSLMHPLCLGVAPCRQMSVLLSVF